ncbi:helix-turn-helix domain-containing protein [Pseudooceanicola nitratireducens]|uniref:helix-turn-helix domain-containing protein n=1 Tax=Pseudooceanicola nitratireducens TaxID=517719 RepID=UPI003C798BB5
MTNPREHFAANLDILIQRRGLPISALCRELGINRTQFNRYKSAESWPRPDVLDRICRYFGVNARIYLEPLDQIERRAKVEVTARIDTSFVPAMPAGEFSPVTWAAE